jgi:hypothetical protein
MLLRAALLRGTISGALFQTGISDLNWVLYDVQYEYDNLDDEKARKIAEQRIRERPVLPDPEYQGLAADLLRIDKALIAARPNQALDAQDELVLAMDMELLAWLGPESDFRPLADQAQEHYLNIIQSGDFEMAYIALVHYDWLAASDAQRLAAVQLFIKSVPNRSGDFSLENRDFGLYSGRELQPTVYAMWSGTSWRNERDMHWAVRLDSVLQRGRANMQISALLAQAYPVLPPS